MGRRAGWASPPHEDRVDLVRRPERRHLPLQGREVAVGQVVDAGQRGEVAVAALVAQKGMWT